MNILLAYYSRTGVTKNTAEIISEKIDCDLEEIKDTKNRLGPLNYIKSGKDATFSSLTKLKPIEKDPSDYDLVIVASPVWSGTMSTPILTYLTENKAKFNNLCFISTCKGSCQKALKDMSEIVEKEPLATMFVDKHDIGSKLEYKIDEFIDNIKNL